MSKNYFRSHLRKLGKGKEKRNKSVTSLESSPAHATIAKHDSSYSLSNVSGSSLAGLNISAHSEDQLERREVINITGDVQNFVAAVSELKKAIEKDDGNNDDNRIEGPVSVDDIDQDHCIVRLKDLIQVVLNCLHQYQGMQSTDIKDAAVGLMSSFQTCDHVTPSHCFTCNSALNMLIDAFTRSVQMFLSGERPEPSHRTANGHANLTKGLSKSHDNLAVQSSSYLDFAQHINEPVVQKIDQGLAYMEDNVEVTAKHLKMRAKYHHDIATYLWKRGQIEMRYHQEVLKLARKTHSIVTELKRNEECLPLVDVFLQSVDQDMRFASNCNTTYNIQVGSKVVEPLEEDVSKNERDTKELMHTWHKQQKKLDDAKTSMKSAKAKYEILSEELAKVKGLLSATVYGKQAEKRKKDMESRCREAEMLYKRAVDICNSCQYQVHKSSQQSILCAYRRNVLDSDHSLKSKLGTYFKLQHNFFLPIPDEMDHFLSKVDDFEVGEDFMQFIERHHTVTEEPKDFLFEEFDPHKEDNEELPSDHCVCSSNSHEIVHDALPLSNDPLRLTHSPPPYHLWVGARETRGLVSPQQRQHTIRPKSVACLFEQDEDVLKMRRYSEQQVPQLRDFSGEDVAVSKNALIHAFIKLRAPSHCRECDEYVYFNGYECETCGLTCHKKCLAALSITCGDKPLDRKLTTFGMDFLRHLEMSKTDIPIIVTKCINAIEERGMDTHGLYRISATKAKLEHLCQLFESVSDRVDLSDKQPHLIASCLKFYFQQLPEPIFTFSLYDDMISFARESSNVLPCDMSAELESRRESAIILLEKLREILSSLDHQRYLTLARLFYHLNRVTSGTYVKKNAMPASNLAIVFGPTLLRTRDDASSLTLLADMTAQAKAIEILITHVNEVFTVSEEEILDAECIDTDVRHITEERLVDGGVETSIQGESEGTAMTPCRTPFGTPPQQRREHINQLGEVFDALQSAIPVRKSLLNDFQTDLPEYYQRLPDDTEHPRLSRSILDSSSSTENYKEDLMAMYTEIDQYTSEDATYDLSVLLQDSYEYELGYLEGHKSGNMDESPSHMKLRSQSSRHSSTQGGKFTLDHEKCEEMGLSVPSSSHGVCISSNVVTQQKTKSTCNDHYSMPKKDQDHHTSSETVRPHSHSTSVSPWHDKNRKKRINPLRVLNSYTPDTTEEPCDVLIRSKSCGIIETRDQTLSLESVSDDVLYFHAEEKCSSEDRLH